MTAAARPAGSAFSAAHSPGCSGQQHDALGERLRGRLVAGHEELLEEREHLAHRQLALGALVGLDVGLHEVRHEVALRVAAPFVELRGEVPLELQDAELGFDAPLVARHRPDRHDGVVGPPFEVGHAIRGHVEHMGDGLDGQRHGEALDELDAALADPAVDEPVDDGFDRRAQRRDRARREVGRDGAAVAGVPRRVDGQQRGHGSPALAHDLAQLVEHRPGGSFARSAEVVGEGGGVTQDGHDEVVAGHEVEVGAGHVEHRGRVPHGRVVGVRALLDGRVERVEASQVDSRHRRSPICS